ncbi:MAG: hypothetical protein ACREO8_07390 [Luteimonas sp.]
MAHSKFRTCFAVAALAVLALIAAGCAPDAPPAELSGPAASPAPPPPAVPDGDPSTATVERASPPMLQAVALGKFEPGNPLAEGATGAVNIEDNTITGANGAKFVTERVALVSGDDHYNAGQRYADPMMIEPRQAVELRRVIEETPPSAIPGNAFCSGVKTGYLALASVMEGDTQVIKVIALSGITLPAASAVDVKLCAATNYFSSKN